MTDLFMPHNHVLTVRGLWVHVVVVAIMFLLLFGIPRERPVSVG